MVPEGGIGGGDGAVSVCGSVEREIGFAGSSAPRLLPFWRALLGTGAGKPAGRPVLPQASEPAPGA